MVAPEAASPQASTSEMCQISVAPSGPVLPGAMVDFFAGCTGNPAQIEWSSSFSNCHPFDQASTVCSFPANGDIPVMVQATYADGFGGCFTASDTRGVAVNGGAPPTCHLGAYPQTPVQPGGLANIYAQCTGTPAWINWTSGQAGCSPASGTQTFCSFPTVGNAVVTATALYADGFGGCFSTAGSYNMLVNPASLPLVASAASRIVHGTEGAFDLPISLVMTNPTSEPRQGPVTIVLTFDKAVTGANAFVTEGTAFAGTPSFNGNTMLVPLTGMINQQYTTLSLANIVASDGGTGGAAVVRMGFLVGDVNQNRVVTISDLVRVNTQLAQPLTRLNFLKDVNANGALTVADRAITNRNLATALPPP
jgi:hypothetical protein